jgi:hypothetical protein
MKDPKAGPTCSVVQHQRGDRRSSLRSLCAILLLTIAVPGICWSQQQTKPGAEPIPEPAIAAILAAFDKYEVVGMPEAHGGERYR